MKFYAGIGSRQTPDEILAIMRQAAAHLADDGWTLRSGAAPGADVAFEYGAAHSNSATIREANSIAQIFLPWGTFGDGVGGNRVRTFSAPARWTYEFVDRFHPAPSKLSGAARKLMARNAHQIFGALPPVEETRPTWAKFVLCWTPNASGSGGTGQAIRIAKAYDIPVFDLADPKVLVRLENFIGLLDS